jgi:nickel/cobalt transporter (NicO) family protein
MGRLLPLIVLVLLPSGALAHPLPNMRFDRNVEVRLERSGVRVVYTLEINEWTMLLDGKSLITPRTLAKLYSERKAPYLADNLIAEFNNKPLSFKAEKIDVEPERDHLRMRFTFRANWPNTSTEAQLFTWEDTNFEDRSGQMTLYLKQSSEQIELSEVVEPVDLRAKSPLDYKPGDEKRARKVSARVQFLDVEKPKELPKVEEPPVQATVSGERPGLFQDIRERGLIAMFDSTSGIGVLLLLSALFGMAHAFTPGHGKTMVAAYLVGERGTFTHAILLGISTTLAHTGGVIALALVVWLVYGDRAPTEQLRGWLTFVGGLLITLVGLWLVLTRLGGKADHVHLFSDHHHDSMPESSGKTGWLRVILLGIGGGIIPCYDAVIMFCFALFQGKIGLAIPLLISFSVGLSLVLIALGLGVVWANRKGSQKFSEKRWFKLLPVISAIILVLLGVWFARDGWHDLQQSEKPAITAQ